MIVVVVVAGCDCQEVLTIEDKGQCYNCSKSHVLHSWSVLQEGLADTGTDLSIALVDEFASTLLH